MSNKMALVTGGTSGIGLSIVEALLAASYDVTFIGHDQERGMQIESRLCQSNPGTQAKFVRLDLSDLRAVNTFTKSFCRRHIRLDLLANVAGTLLPKREETKDGIEKTFAVSYLAAFLLARELLPLLDKPDRARIVNVAASPSIVLKPGLDFGSIDAATTKYSGFKASVLAVHAKTVFTQHLAQRLSESAITVNAFHPGNVKSKLFRNMPAPARFAMRFVMPFFATSSRAANHACLSDAVQDVSGKLFVGTRPIDLNFDADYQLRLWHHSENIMRRVCEADPGLQPNAP